MSYKTLQKGRAKPYETKKFFWGEANKNLLKYHGFNFQISH